MTRAQRVLLVIAATAGAVFFLAGMAVTPGNRDVIAPIAVGALLVLLLCGLLIGLIWAWRGDA